MSETNQNQPATVPQQPEAPSPLKKSTPRYRRVDRYRRADRNCESFQPRERQQEVRASPVPCRCAPRLPTRSKLAASRRSST